MLITWSYIFTQVPILLLTVWTFRLHDAKFPNLLHNSERITFYDVGKYTGKVLGASVSKYGKLGGWLILITILTTTIILFISEREKSHIRLHPPPRRCGVPIVEHKHDFRNKILAVIILKSVVFGLLLITLIIHCVRRRKDCHLLVKSIPFYSLQLGTLLTMGYHLNTVDDLPDNH